MVVTFASDAGKNGGYVHLLTVVKVGIPAGFVFLTCFKAVLNSFLPLFHLFLIQIICILGC
jgi:hypothetical protein